MRLFTSIPSTRNPFKASRLRIKNCRKLSSSNNSNLTRSIFIRSPSEESANEIIFAHCSITLRSRIDLVVLTSKLSTTLVEDVAVSFVSEDSAAFMPSKNFFVPCAEIDEVKPYCSSKLLVLSVSIFVSMTLFIIIAISYTLLKFK